MMENKSAVSDADVIAEPPTRFELLVFVIGLFCTLLPVFIYAHQFFSEPTTMSIVTSRTTLAYFPPTAIGLVLTYCSVINAIRRSSLGWRHVMPFVLSLAVCFTISAGFVLGAIMCAAALFLAHRGDETTRLDYIIPVFLLGIGLYFTPSLFPGSGDRSLVSRCQADMRSLAIAIESYYVDHKAFPVSTTDPALRAHWKSDSKMPGFMKFRPQGPSDITTPTQYTSLLPTDPYRLYRDDRTYSYYNHQDKTWILISPGPDCVFDIKPGDLPEIMTKLIDGDSTMLAVNAYDPTNGSISSGDVYRYKH